MCVRMFIRVMQIKLQKIYGKKEKTDYSKVKKYDLDNSRSLTLLIFKNRKAIHQFDLVSFWVSSFNVLYQSIIITLVTWLSFVLPVVLSC